MEYIYITDNNLEKKQKYNYSQYGGDDFLDAYVESRRTALRQLSEAMPEHSTYRELKSIRNRLLSQKSIDASLKDEVDAYVKTFEVRKRLYGGYGQDWKPLSDKYDDYINYILFAQILISVYTISKNIKYLSCLIKLDDTLISLLPMVPLSIQTDIKDILEAEMAGYEHCKSSIEEN